MCASVVNRPRIFSSLSLLSVTNSSFPFSQALRSSTGHAFFHSILSVFRLLFFSRRCGHQPVPHHFTHFNTCYSLWSHFISQDFVFFSLFFLYPPCCTAVNFQLQPERKKNCLAHLANINPAHFSYVLLLLTLVSYQLCQFVEFAQSVICLQDIIDSC